MEQRQRQEWQFDVTLPLQRQIADQQKQIADQQNQIKTLQFKIESQTMDALQSGGGAFVWALDPCLTRIWRCVEGNPVNDALPGHHRRWAEQAGLLCPGHDLSHCHKTLAPLMREAGFRYVFLGIENILEGDLQFLRATAKNTERDRGQHVGNASVKAIDYLRQNKMFVVGGLIVGNPDDTRESIEANLAFARRYVDWPYIQHPTPYPRTPMTEQFRERGLIMNQQLEEYDGTTAVVRTEHVAAEEVEHQVLVRKSPSGSAGLRC